MFHVYVQCNDLILTCISGDGGSVSAVRRPPGGQEERGCGHRGGGGGSVWRGRQRHPRPLPGQVLGPQVRHRGRLHRAQGGPGTCTGSWRAEADSGTLACLGQLSSPTVIQLLFSNALKLFNWTRKKHTHKHQS